MVLTAKSISNTAVEEGKGAFWAEHIKLSQSGKLSHAAYCRKYKLSYCQFLYWKQKLASHPLQLVAVRLNIPESSSTIQDNSAQDAVVTLCTVVFKNGNELKVHSQEILPALISGLS